MITKILVSTITLLLTFIGTFFLASLSADMMSTKSTSLNILGIIFMTITLMAFAISVGDIIKKFIKKQK
jgi:hypothetical protein